MLLADVIAMLPLCLQLMFFFSCVDLSFCWFTFDTGTFSLLQNMLLIVKDKMKHTCGKYGIQVHFKGNTTIKQILMKPKDRDPKDSKSGLIYSYQCPQLDCNEEYIGETGRTLGERRKKHLKQPSPIHGHSQATEHPIDNNNFNIIGREDWGQARTIKESIYIRVNNPTLNQNIGKYNLNHIWDRVLFNTPRLKLGSSQHPAVIQ